MPNGKFERPSIGRIPEEEKKEIPGERPEDKVLRAGDLVEVFSRTSLEKEGGWEIVGWEKGQTIVRKKEGDKLLEERIPAIEIAAMNAPETTRIGFKKEEWKKLWERWGGELPENWDETVKEKGGLSVKEARGLFSQIPSSFETKREAWLRLKSLKGQRIRLDWDFDDFVHKERIDVSGERLRAERLQACFGRKIPFELLSKEEQEEETKRIREITGT